MAIKDIFRKIKGRVTGEGDLLDTEEELGIEEFPEEKMGPAPKEESLLDEPPETELGAEPAPAKPEEPAPADTSEIKTQLEAIKNKLEALESHLQSMESKGEMQRAEEERFMQYLSFLNEKLDHLEEEHSELERLLQEKKT